MGFFDRLKASKDGTDQERIKFPWHYLDQMEQLEMIVEESAEKPIALFKHSTRCGVSRGVLKAFERGYSITDGKVKLYFLDLLSHRNISNEVASRFQVHHESPQLIVIRKGEVVYQNSHNSIDPEDLEKFV